MDDTKNVPPNPMADKNAPSPKPDDVVYNVMPQEGKSFTLSANVPASAPKADGGQMASSGSRKWVYIIIGLLVLVILGALAYFLLGFNNKATPVVEQPTTKLSKAWLQQYFNSDTCADQTTCGDNADPDNDGLTNVQEFTAKTNPLNPDTDSDGLADGDEVNVYKIDPVLKYTDRREIVATNDWTDGYQVKNGYDPVTGQKMTDARMAQIATDTTTYHLHEPSITTTTTSVTTPTPTPAATQPAATKPKTMNITIQNSAFGSGTLNVNKGDTVVWTNKDPMAHTVASDSGAFTSPSLATNESFSYTFTAAGTFAYHCSIHPNMKATIVVK